MLVNLGGGKPASGFEANMKLFFPIAFSAIVFYTFVLPWFQFSQNSVARLVAIAVSK